MADEEFLFPRPGIKDIFQETAHSHFHARYGDACRVAAAADEDDASQGQDGQDEDGSHLNGNIEEILDKDLEVRRRGNGLSHEREAAQIADSHQEQRQDEGQFDAAVEVEFHEETDIAQHRSNIEAADHSDDDGEEQANRTVADDAAIAEFLGDLPLFPVVQRQEDGCCRRSRSAADSPDLEEQGPFGDNRADDRADNTQGHENIVLAVRQRNEQVEDEDEAASGCRCRNGQEQAVRIIRRHNGSPAQGVTPIRQFLRNQLDIGQVRLRQVHAVEGLLIEWIEIDSGIAFQVADVKAHSRFFRRNLFQFFLGHGIDAGRAVMDQASQVIHAILLIILELIDRFDHIERNVPFVQIVRRIVQHGLAFGIDRRITQDFFADEHDSRYVLNLIDAVEEMGYLFLRRIAVIRRPQDNVETVVADGLGVGTEDAQVDIA